MSGCPVRLWLSVPKNLRFLRSLIWRMVRTQQDVDDVFSLTVERMLHRSCTYVGEVEKVGAWSRAVAQTTAINYLKRDFSYRSVEWQDRDEASAESVEREIEQEEYVERLREVYDGLSDVEREAVTHRARNGYITGERRNTLNTALRRARAKTRTIIEEEGVWG